MIGPLIGATDPSVAIEPQLSEGFCRVFGDGVFGPPGDARERLDALQRIPQARGFALICVDGAPAAVGACAIDGDWAGLMAMRTSPAHRRLGLARRVFRALCAFARESGARRGYLQVEEDNASALGLYASEGFGTLYAYRYWARPELNPV